jgi:nucleotidyltransferase substrate binding protein (TIGR01987 family)
MQEDNLDIRWKQRFSNYVKALHKLEEAVLYVTQNNIDVNEALVLDDIIKEGLIQRFEYTHELAWNVMKDYAAYQGNISVGGSRDATREAFKMQLFAEGHIWMDMIKSRNETSHTYNQELANEIYDKILKDYYPAFLAFKTMMLQKNEI